MDNERTTSTGAVSKPGPFGRLRDRIVHSHESNAAYFSEYGEQIARRNLSLMRIMGYVSAMIFIVYYLLTVTLFPQWTISMLYGLIVPVVLAFALYAEHTRSLRHISPRLANAVSVLFLAALMGFVIVMSVFPHPDVPSVYFPLALLVVPVVFVLPTIELVVSNVVSTAVFFYLVFMFKEPSCWSHELFEAFTSFVFSMVVIGHLRTYRMNTDNIANAFYERSIIDELTGTLNKVSGERRLAAYLDRRSSDECFAVLFMDIDRFKSYNDEYGHLKGDELLQSVGNLLTSFFRSNDTVCRFGGDEFLILLPNVGDETVACERAQALLDQLGALGESGNIPFSCSMGIYCGKPVTPSVTEVLNCADKALYRAKARGRNCYVLYDINTPSYTAISS